MKKINKYTNTCRFHTKVYDDCHDATQKAMRFINFATDIIRKNGYRIKF